MIRRVHVEKKEGFNTEARRLKEELTDFLGGKYAELSELKNLRILRRYDVSDLDEEQLKQVTETVFSEPQCDRVFINEVMPPVKENADRFFGIQYLPG